MREQTMKKIILSTVMISTIIIFCSSLKAAAGDFSGIWITKASKSQTIVKKSGNRYTFEKISFHKGKKNSFKGYMTEKKNRMILKYEAGVTASATIVNPKLIIESSTVKWEKISNSTKLPNFNLTGRWKSSNTMTLKQTGNRLSGKDSRGNTLSGKIYGYTFYLDAISKKGFKINYTYLVENNNRILSSSFYSKASYITRIGTAPAISSPKKIQKEKKDKKEYSAVKSISGKWKTKYYNGKMKISQINNRIIVQGQYNYFFKKVKWAGNGTINGNKITLKYHYIKNKPRGWAKKGVMNLKLKGNNRLKGKWIESERKRKGKISFKKK